MFQNRFAACRARTNARGTLCDGGTVHRLRKGYRGSSADAAVWPPIATTGAVRLAVVSRRSLAAAKTDKARREWRKLDGSNYLAGVIQRVAIKDGVKRIKHAA